MFLEERPEDTVDTTMPFPDEDTIDTTVLPSSPFNLPNEQEDSTMQSTGLDEEEKREENKEEVSRSLEPTGSNRVQCPSNRGSYDQLRRQGAKIERCLCVDHGSLFVNGRRISDGSDHSIVHRVKPRDSGG